MKTNHFSRVFLLTALVVLGTQLFAQGAYEIKGKIVKSERESTNHASVTLLDSKTLEIVADCESDNSGTFLIENVKKGDYILVVQKPGYSKPDRRYITITGKGTTIETTRNFTEVRNEKSNDIQTN